MNCALLVVGGWYHRRPFRDCPLWSTLLPLSCFHWDSRCLLPLPLYQCYFAVEIRLLFGVEFQGHAAGCSDPLQHRQRVPGVFGVLKTGDHGLRGANLPREFGLSQARILSHLAAQESQVNLMQSALEGLAVRSALSRSRLDDLAVSVALSCLFHRPIAFRIASLSFSDP